MRPGWPTTTLGRVGRFHMGTTFPHAYQGAAQGDLPFIKVSDFPRADRLGVVSGANNWVDRQTARRLGARIVPRGSILYARVGAALLLNQRCITGRTCIVDDNVRAFEPEHGDPRYWRYLMLLLDMAKITNPGPVPSVSERQVAALPVPLPSVEEQRHIADFLDAETVRIDQLRRKFNRQRDLLVERERASLPLGVAGARLGEGSVDTGLPWLPSMHPRAQLVPLIRLLQLQRGADLTDDQRRPGEVPVVTTAGPNGWHDIALASGPGVVIGRYGSVGNVHWVDDSYWPHNTTLYVKNFNGNDPRYCYHVLRSLPYEMEQARAAVPGVNRNDLHRNAVVLLPRDLQLRVARLLDSDMTRLASAFERIRRADALLAERRQALITAAVTGQFDVSTASGRNVTDGVTA
ncbi:restriction endonuclease subunit S [Streptomyces sp. CA-243310]|uniref:restriction endonuclease subunit S n=1 Tax=Streptomyces sp. CA-243310 TaxID=3240056 RepID=UPI003D9362A2